MHKAALASLGTLETIADIREQEARALLCKKGIGSNLLEFARHVLGQRQAAVPLLRGYDQGYILKKKGSSPSSPWIVSLGPVAVLALVHCALAGMGGPRSVHRLGQHLEAYGVAVDKHDIARNDLGHQLRMLGLVLDSPDAESGMLLLPPSPQARAPNMNRLAHWLAAIVHEKVRGATQGYGGSNLEYRLIFRGPPLEILEPAYDELARDGGIQVPARLDGSMATLPVLLQYPANQLQGPRPRIGASGKCDNDHLLDVRNDPANPSFVALVPPGLHNNLSIESTTDEFGLGTATSTGHASFEQWWEDGFVQQAVNEALLVAGIEDSQRDDAKGLVRAAAASVDEVDPDKSGHRAAWRLLSRIYSIANENHGLPPGKALSLACGLPPMKDGEVSSKTQLSVLGKSPTSLRTASRLASNAWHKVPRRRLRKPCASCYPTSSRIATYLRPSNAPPRPSTCQARMLTWPLRPPGGQCSPPSNGPNYWPTSPTKPLGK